HLAIPVGRARLVLGPGHLVRLVPRLPVAHTRLSLRLTGVPAHGGRREPCVFGRVDTLKTVELANRPGRRAGDVDDRLEAVAADEPELRVQAFPVVGGLVR